MLRDFIYDGISILIVLFYVYTFVVIIRDVKKQGIITVLVGCILNLVFPILGFLIYCIFSKYKRKGKYREARFNIFIINRSSVLGIEL